MLTPRYCKCKLWAVSTFPFLCICRIQVSYRTYYYMWHHVQVSERPANCVQILPVQRTLSPSNLSNPSATCSFISIIICFQGNYSSWADERTGMVIILFNKPCHLSQFLFASVSLYWIAVFYHITLLFLTLCSKIHDLGKNHRCFVQQLWECFLSLTGITALRYISEVYSWFWFGTGDEHVRWKQESWTVAGGRK